jgi:hypothetical protein
MKMTDLCVITSYLKSHFTTLEKERKDMHEKMLIDFSHEDGDLSSNDDSPVFFIKVKSTKFEEKVYIKAVFHSYFRMITYRKHLLRSIRMV